MLIFLQEFALQLFLWLLQMVDGITDIFSAVTGVMNVKINGEQVHIIEYLMGDSTVTTIFWCVFILAIGLACIFAIVGLIKNMVTAKNNVSSVVGKFFLSILGTLCMVAVVFVGILIADSMLVMVAKIFRIGNSARLSNSLFNACVGEWVNGYSINEINVTDLSVRQILGDYDTCFFGIWPATWKMDGMVNPNSFRYFPALVAAVAVFIAVFIATINLCKRVYEIVILYLIMPMSMSTLPLDDGARCKAWRETFITKIVLAYGAVFAVNVFVLLLPIISKMKVDGFGDFGNAIFFILMVIGGALTIPATQNLFARLFGQPDDMHAGSGIMHNAFYAGRAVGALTVGPIAKSVARRREEKRQEKRQHRNEQKQKIIRDAENRYEET